MTPDLDELVEQGRAALAVADWSSARACFERAADSAETAQILDGLGQALCWQGSYQRGLALRERAYAAYRQQGDHRVCAFSAVQLAALHWLVYGNGAAASGWAGQATRMAERAGDCPERGWVELLRADGAEEFEERVGRARSALEIGRRFGDTGLEFDALAAVGQSLVGSGRVDEGMRLIDEAVAAVSSGVVTDPWATAEIYCKLFSACELTADVRRTQQWLEAVDHYVDRTADVPTAGICRMHYGGVLTAAGRWDDAERELVRSIDIYDATYRGTRHEPVLRLADLRVRQGRLEEAQQLVAGYDEDPEATRPRLGLHLARGEPQLAVHIARRHLAHRGRGLASVPVLSLLVEAELKRDALAEAAAVADELAGLAAAIPHPALDGFASWAQARVAAASGDDTAVARYEQTVTAFAAVGLPYELGRARLELAALLAPTDGDVARLEARAALAGLEQLGAHRDADAAAALLRRLGDRGRSWPKGFGTLTKRETEVLQLVAQGLSNVEIGERLYISHRTAEHHVGNILSKLGVTSRAQAAAHAHAASSLAP